MLPQHPFFVTEGVESIFLVLIAKEDGQLEKFIELHGRLDWIPSLQYIEDI